MDCTARYPGVAPINMNKGELSRIKEGKVLEETYQGYETSKESIKHSIRRYRRIYLYMSV